MMTFRFPMKLNPSSRLVFAAVVLPVLFAGCTSEPLLSRKGGVAAVELTVQSLVVLGRGTVNPVEQNLEASDVNYIGGVIPVKKQRRERARPVEKGTRLLVDGHARGPIPLVANLAKPGPHTVRLEITAWQPYTFKLGNPFRLPVGSGKIESWPPVLVNCKTGEIFTAEKLPSFDPYLSTAFRVGPDPMLIVTTTDKHHRGRSKIGQMTPIAVSR